MDRIDPDAALNQLIFPPTKTVNKHLRKAYVTSTYDFLRSNPGESYSIGGLRPHIIDGTKIDGGRTPMLPGEWYREMVAPHLHWLPGVFVNRVVRPGASIRLPWNALLFRVIPPIPRMIR